MSLPRTLEIEAIAHNLMREFAEDPTHPREGKMYGVLLVVDQHGQQRILKAFSGLLKQQAELSGWVPPIPGRGQVALAEQETLEQLQQIRDQLWFLQQDYQTQQAQYQTHLQQYQAQWHTLSQHHKQQKLERQELRQQIHTQSQNEAQQLTPLKDGTLAIATLDHLSRQAGLERRAFKRDRNTILLPLQESLLALETQIQALKKSRKALSQQLQAHMHQSYWLSNFAGISARLQEIYPGDMPTGTGDCCAPKLLHFAATQGWTPLALAEFWWGNPSSNGDKQPGEFFPPCRDRCQPLMEFLLSGLSDPFPGADSNPDLKILYEESRFIAVEKPPGLLSVPGRSHSDCALGRAQQQLNMPLWAVHRLDQDTSGLLLLAKDLDTYRQLSRQFQARQVTKTYIAILAGHILQASGVIDLPLWGDPRDRPRQSVHWQQGKPSQTYFQVLGQVGEAGEHTRLQMQPITGRTHQLRVHAADPQGFGIAILGDRLYGKESQDSHVQDSHVQDSHVQPKSNRLYLHAQSLRFQHPQTGRELIWVSPPPF